MYRSYFVKLLGDRQAHSEGLRVAVAMLAVAAIYELSSSLLAPGYAFNTFEFVGTWSGLICVWLSRTRNILCWPWGIVSSIALGIFFAQIHLPGQEWLNLGYFTAVQLWAWPYWAFGGKDNDELPVTAMNWRARALTVGAIVLGTYAIYRTIGFFSPGSFHPILDSLVVSSSVTAQYLLGRKKVESWILWLGPVNLLSIILFFSSGAYTVTALYVAFFIHALFALRSWNKARTDNATAYGATI